MNWKHVNALIAGCPLYTADIDGKRLISDGRVAFILTDGIQIDVTRARERPGFAALWKEWESREILSPEKPGACYGAGKTFSRSIGKVYVAERYFRCFGPEATWLAASGRPLESLLPACVFLDNVMIGAVMPRRMDEPGIAVAEPSDEEVFAPFACHENDWYFVSEEAIEEQIEAAESERERAQEAIEGAEGRLEAANDELRSLRGRRAKTNCRPPGASTTPDPGEEPPTGSQEKP